MGRLVAYPISALFIKDVEFTFDEQFKKELVDIAESHSQNNATMALGIINLTGSSSARSNTSKKSGLFSSKTTTTSSSSATSSSNRENSSSSSSDESSNESKKTHLIETEGGKGLRIEGMQLVGFINNYIPKCPNTNPDIEDNRFV